MGHWCRSLVRRPPPGYIYSALVAEIYASTSYKISTEPCLAAVATTLAVIARKGIHSVGSACLTACSDIVSSLIDEYRLGSLMIFGVYPVIFRSLFREPHSSLRFMLEEKSYRWADRDLIKVMKIREIHQMVPT